MSGSTARLLALALLVPATAGAVALGREWWARPGAAAARAPGAAMHDAPLAARAARLDALLGRPTPPPARPLPPARLRLSSTRGESIDVVPFDAQGRPRASAFDAISRLFRANEGKLVAIDPRLVELLVTLGARFPDRTMLLVSGHRDPDGRTSARSYHVRGMAADVAVEGEHTLTLYHAARALGARGTGYYPHFVHLDVRAAPYRWSGR
jgi:uncharacterized protein YcbK (DUF882 family)